MDAKPESARRGGSRRRRLLIGGAVLLLLPVLWLAGANVALNAGLVTGWINHHPEKLLIEWRSGWSVNPWRIHLRGVRVRGQGHRDQWYSEADRADLRIRLLPLLTKRVVTDSARLEHVIFRIRPRLDAIPPGSVDPANLPEIPGLSNPPKVAPVLRRHGPSAHPWWLELGGIDIEDLQELWIKESRLTGGGHVQGSVLHAIRSNFTAQVTRFDLAPSHFYLRGKGAVTNVQGRLQGTLGPVIFHNEHGVALLRHLSLDTDLTGDLADQQVYERHLGKVRSIGISGGGHLKAHVEMDHGRLLPLTRVGVDSPQLEVRLLKVFIRGRADVGLEVAEGTNGITSTMSVVLSDLRFRHRDETAVAANSGDLRLRAVAYDPQFPEGFRDVEFQLELAPLELPDSRVLNAFLPENIDLSFLKGRFRVSANYAETRKHESSGRLRLDGDSIEFRLGERDFSGRIEAATAYQSLTNHLVRLGDAHLLVTNVIVSGVKNRHPEGWYAAVGIDQGTLNLAGSNTVTADATMHLQDLRPLLAVLREDENAPGWTRWVPNVRDLRGIASVKVAPRQVVVRDLAMRGKATEIMAQLKIADGKPDGILYIRYGLISAGFDFRGGRKDWTILGAKRGYLKTLAEMGLEGAPTPEDVEKMESSP